MAGKDKKNWRANNRPYIIAFVLAFVMTMLVAPEMMEGDSMEPAIADGQAVCVVKESYSAKRGQPELEEVVVLEKVYSEDYAEDNIIGRVVGLPGDKIEIKDGSLYRNGKLYEAGGSSECSGKCSVILDKDSVFILADNRSAKNTADSRTIGPVPMKEIKGNAKVIIWPLGDIGRIR